MDERYGRIFVVAAIVFALLVFGAKIEEYDSNLHAMLPAIYRKKCQVKSGQMHHQNNWNETFWSHFLSGDDQS